VSAIIESMKWLGLDYEGPSFQMDRLARYREVAEQLIREDRAYYCYASREELDALREQQRARNEKPRYDGRWRPENAQRLALKPPAGAQPVVRFRNPGAGEVIFTDLVKGEITVANAELDDLVLLRADGIPTYNFSVVVDTSTWRSRTSSAVTTTSTTRRARSTSTARSVRRCRGSRTCRSSSARTRSG
jgi:glutamyl-tRNA synthetase